MIDVFCGREVRARPEGGGDFAPALGAGRRRTGTQAFWPDPQATALLTNEARHG
jgi:hypothetical protein